MIRCDHCKHEVQRQGLANWDLYLHDPIGELLKKGQVGFVHPYGRRLGNISQFGEICRICGNELGERLVDSIVAAAKHTVEKWKMEEE